MKIWHILIGLAILVLILMGIIIINPKPTVSNLILTGINLFLVFGYVIATFNIMKISQNNIDISKKSMEISEQNMKLLKSPVISVVITKWPRLPDDDTDEDTKTNKIAILLDNKTKNYAKDVRVKVRALVNGREFIGSHPINGEKDFYVQAEYKILQKILMQEEFLSRAQTSIQALRRIATDENFETQFVLKVQVSHSDGLGENLDLPELSWYYDFRKKAWNFIG